MMRNIAIGLAAATIVLGGSTLSGSALYGQESGISKGSMSGSAKSQRFGPRTYGFYSEERARGNRLAELTPMQRERLRRIVRERFAELTPMLDRVLAHLVDSLGATHGMVRLLEGTGDKAELVVHASVGFPPPAVAEAAMVGASPPPSVPVAPVTSAYQVAGTPDSATSPGS